MREAQRGPPTGALGGAGGGLREGETRRRSELSCLPSSRAVRTGLAALRRAWPELVSERALLQPLGLWAWRGPAEGLSGALPACLGAPLASARLVMAAASHPPLSGSQLSTAEAGGQQAGPSPWGLSLFLALSDFR